MKNVTIISYPGEKLNSLLSLNDLYSSYMIPFGGRFRIIDFVLRNSINAKLSQTIICSRVKDGLTRYVRSHTGIDEQNKINVMTRKNFNIDSFLEILNEFKNSYYILYNGSNPSLIDFKDVMHRYHSKKAASIFFKIKIGQKASMASPILVTDKCTILNVLKKARKEKKDSPNFFEMLINQFIIKSIKSEVINTYYRPLRNIPEYYSANMELCQNSEIGNLIFNDPLLFSGIVTDHIAQIGIGAEIRNSFISDGCIINGKVSESILFPGVIIAEKAIVRKSIILPNVAIGQKAQIENTIIDEFTDLNKTEILFNIGTKCIIGSNHSGIKNKEYPESIYKSISLIGKNCIVPPSIRIGSACFLPTGTTPRAFRKSKVLHDGLVLEIDKNTAL